MINVDCDYVRNFVLTLLFMVSHHICRAIYNKNIQAVSFISLLLKEISAADGSVQLPEPPWPLVTYINPLSLMGLSVFKVQVERRLPSQPVVLNFHIPNREVCEFYVHEHT